MPSNGAIWHKRRRHRPPPCEQIAEQLQPLVAAYEKQEGDRVRASRRLAEASLMYLRKHELGDGGLFLRNKKHRPPVAMVAKILRVARREAAKRHLGRGVPIQVLELICAGACHATYINYQFRS